MTEPKHFVRDSGIDWDKSKTLKETIFDLFRERKTGTEEFKAILAYVGRERMLQYKKEFLESIRSQKGKAS